MECQGTVNAGIRTIVNKVKRGLPVFRPQFEAGSPNINGVFPGMKGIHPGAKQVR